MEQINVKKVTSRLYNVVYIYLLKYNWGKIKLNKVFKLKICPKTMKTMKPEPAAESPVCHWTVFDVTSRVVSVCAAFLTSAMLTLPPREKLKSPNQIQRNLKLSKLIKMTPLTEWRLEVRFASRQPKAVAVDHVISCLSKNHFICLQCKCGAGVRKTNSVYSVWFTIFTNIHFYLFYQ